MKIQESTICENFKEALKAQNLGWDPATTYVIGECMCASMANFLSVKRTEQPVIIVLRDFDNVFQLAMIADFIKNEDAVDEDAAKGNFVLSATMNEADLDQFENPIVFTNSDAKFVWITKDVSYRLHHMSYINDQMITLLFSTFMTLLRQWLDTAAKEGEKVVIESDGYWRASVEVVDGVKEMAFIPGEITKHVFKGTNDSEVQN